MDWFKGGMNFVNGEWVGHSPDFASLNPSTEQELGFFPITEGSAVQEAVDAAKCALPRWKEESRVKRADYIDELANVLRSRMPDLIEAISLETGKTANESFAEAMESLHMCQVAAGSGRMPYGECLASELPEKDAYMIRKPKGVVAIVSPWNFPAAIGGFWNAAAALVEGNTVVWKPSEYTPKVAQLVTSLYNDAFLPPGVFNLIHGMDKTGEELVQDPHVDCVLFTGSAEVGMKIRQHCASTWHKTCACEMGSKSAMMVFSDAWHAHREAVLDACVASAFKLSGQRCVSAGRILVHRSVVNEFAAEFKSRVESLKVGPPEDADAYFGPLISSEAIEKVVQYNQLARDGGVDILFDGGDRLERDGYFISPFVYQSEWGNHRFLKEEVFGPHVAIIPFDDVDEAIDVYNDTDYGLSLGVFTEDFRVARKCRDRCDFGLGYWNGACIGAESHLGFGGVKKSGNGWSSAARTFQAVTHEVAWTVNHAKGEFKFPQGMKTK